MTQPPPHSGNSEHDARANTNPFVSSDPNDMDVDDDIDEFLDGSDADDFPSDFGSDYESAWDDLGDALPSLTDPPPNTTHPPSSMTNSLLSTNNLPLSTTDTPLSTTNTPPSTIHPLTQPLPSKNNPFLSTTNPLTSTANPLPSTTSPFPRSRSPPAYSVAQADGQDDINLALALSASMHSPALGTGRGPSLNPNPWGTQQSTGLSAADEKALQRERELAWQPPRASVSELFPEFDPPKYSAFAAGGGARSSVPLRKPMCVVCEVKPAFNNGQRSFPTCGNTCARLLDEAQKAIPKPRLPPNSNHGQMGNPNRGGGSSSSRGTSAGNQALRGTSNSTSPIKMCQVCHLRPIYQKGGKVYPTCGLTCAAKMHPPGSIPMCDYCHERPKVVINNKIFPHCGRTCRDKAKAAGSTHNYTARATSSASNSYSSVTSSAVPRKSIADAACTTCILCWAMPRRGPKDDFCSDLCKDLAVQQGPFLLEIPRGHASFQVVEQFCIDNWKTKQSNYPIIKRIYMVQPHADFDATYRDYQARLSPAVGPNRTGNEVRSWIAPSRQCSLGDEAHTTPCNSTKCMLCSLVRTSSSKGTYGKGLLAQLELERAVERATRISKGQGSILLLSQVLLGNWCEKSKNELDNPLPAGYDSIRLVEYTMLGFGSQYDGDNIVFDGRAIKPMYLISFE